MVQRNGRSPSTSLHCYNQQYAKSYLTHVHECIEKSSVPMKVKVSVEIMPFILMTWWLLLSPKQIVGICWSE